MRATAALTPAPQLKTQLALTPELRQSLHILHMGTAELLEHIENALQENPLLERTDEENSWENSESNSIDNVEDFDGDLEGDFSTDFEWDFDPDIQADFQDSPSDSSSDATAADLIEQHPCPAPGLHAHLHAQVCGLLGVDAAQAQAMHYLIDCLDDDGHLHESLAAIAARLLATSAQPHTAHDDDDPNGDQLLTLVQTLRQGLAHIATLEPAGCGTTGPAPSLRLQLRQLQAQPRPKHPNDLSGVCPTAADMDAVYALAHELIDIFERHAPATTIAQAVPSDTQLIAQCPSLAAHTCSTQRSRQQLHAARAVLRQLHPHPGRHWQQQHAEQQSSVRIAEIIFHNKYLSTSTPEPTPNDAALPRLQLHPLYAQCVRAGKSEKSNINKDLQTHAHNARTLIEHIAQRQHTLVRIAQAIARHQSAYLRSGQVQDLRPLSRKQIACELGLAESTISRATHGKCAQVGHQVVDFEIFFPAAAQHTKPHAAPDAPHTWTADAARSHVHGAIAALVAAEDRTHPLSDAAIAQALQAQGLSCARRTVAKYRQQLHIPDAPTRAQPSPPANADAAHLPAWDA